MNCETNLKKARYLTAICSFFLIFCLLAISFADRSYAAEPRTIRVGFFPMEGYNDIGEDGSYTGMDVEYLAALCDYTNWEIEYVECDSWDDALRRLADRQIDLVGSAQYSAERAELYQYADLPSGYTYGVIAVNADSTLAYEDFVAMQDLTFGVVATYVRRQEFLEYMEDNGVVHPRLREYKNTAELIDALDRGEIDAMVHTLTEIRAGQRMVGRFAPMPFYYISYQGNKEVMRILNHAISDLKINRPELENELMTRFYQDKLDHTVVFSTEEKAYIAAEKEIIVGYLDGFYPFSYEEDGEFMGLTRQVLENLASMVGLHFTYQKMESLEQADQALLDGSVDLLGYYPDSEHLRQTNGLQMVRAYAEVPLVVVTKNSQTSPIETLAIVSYLPQDVAANVNAEAQLTVYDTQKECLTAVRQDTVEAALCDGYLAEYLMGSELQYSRLNVQNVLSYDQVICMVVKSGENPNLAGILNKLLVSVSSQQISEYMLQNNISSLMSIDRFIRNNSLLLLSIMALAAGIVLFIAIRMVYDSRKIQKLMYKDAALNIWNLNYLTYCGAAMLAEKKEKYAVAYLNLSQFRLFNTIYGWQQGQKLLESVVEVLSEKVEKNKEIYARNQGDRFVMLLAWNKKEGLLTRLEALEKSIEERIFEDTGNRMTINMGVYFIPHDSLDMNDAVARANQAMDFLHGSQVSQIKVFDESLEDLLREQHERERLLETVDINKDFATYYQAKVDIRNERIVGAEALVRFLDPTAGGQVRSPAFFIPYYEKTGKVTDIDFFVMECACKMIHRRMEAGKSVVPISCNFSRIHFMKSGFLERFEGIIEKYQVPKELIEVEITETLVMEELQQQMIQQTINQLRERGIRLSIDDFGSGYSSLGVFERVPASVIKLDRSFLLNKEDRERQVTIMCNIVQMARELDAQIVCEGVETEKDVELMKEIGAFVAQGFRYSRPIAEKEFEEKLDG